MEEIELNNGIKLDTNPVLENHFKEILTLIGEDPTREGLLKTPSRVASALQFTTHGYQLDPIEIVRSAIFHEEHNQMVIVKDIELYSMCEHHMLPFFGKAHVAYIPNTHVVGLSKLNRIVRYFARRPQVQERMTIQIANMLKQTLGTNDVAVVIEADHLCVASRGVKDATSNTITSEYCGKFLDVKTREEFLHYINM